MSTLDLVVFISYCAIIIGVGLYISTRKRNIEKTSQDYFLAGKSLTWWAIGASFIAANISAEQFIGMSGSGFALGIAISSYEWMGALTLLLVGKFLLPIFIKKQIYTMPQFLAERYNKNVKTVMATFWIGVYVFVNLTSVLYLGSLAIETVMGVDRLTATIALALFAMGYSIYGGLSAVAWTDVIQVIVLVIGGLATTYLALDQVGDGAGAIEGFQTLMAETSSHFDSILDRSHPYFKDLPGWGVIIGGMWIANISYWGLNQYIVQRALAAKSLKDAQLGVMFAGYLKLLMPLIVVVPGIAAYYLVQKEGLVDVGNMQIASDAFNSLGDESITKVMVDPDLMEVKKDKAYPALLGFLPSGFKGIAFAALVAAIISSLASMANSTATIFTMDIYKEYIGKNASETKLVKVGRLAALIGFVLAVLVSPLLSELDQAFQYIQEYTGFVTPGVVAIFLLGMFWKKTTPNAALVGGLATFIASILFKQFMDHVPFLDRMGYVFLICCVLMIVTSLLEGKGQPSSKALTIGNFNFKTSPAFNIGAVGICIILTVLYIVFQ
ncbi:sodium/sugar symporter [Roseivirga misakiensis]|uniref:Sodium/glucose cotransporter n=1 Tax=Roseivirga misakiensis TaxID=1563681 RepID=A0A1E5T219_9BACT|nr:sodium/sugar symporter [Roseivirga misakiensis]OEK05406.1 sodium/glucose cotransporter [Roseivirga misakiensis]